MPSISDKIKVIQTAKDTGDRLTQKQDISFVADDNEGLASIQIDSNKVFQKLEGFGGAITEASVVTINKMSPDKREEILNAYYNPETGLGYELCRVHINSCDFSLENYAYDEVPGDTELKHFKIDRDKGSIIPMLKEAMKIKGSNLKILSSPWSPPAWMKTNGEMNNGGKLKEEYMETWARYYAKYIREYEKEGIPIWAISVQNEPAAVQVWDSCIYTAEDERDFVINSNELHSIENTSDELMYHVIIIDISLLQSNFLDACEAKYIAPITQNLILFKNKISGDKNVIECISSIINEYKHKKIGFELAVKSYIYRLLVLLLRNHVQKVLTENEYNIRLKNLGRFYEVIKYIEDNYSEEIDIKKLSDISNISLFHFCRLFKEVTGKTPINYINYYRILKAESLIMNSELNITEIALATGFNDINYFSRIFKKYKKASPTQLRKEKP